jgi:hypothetical protein
VYLDGPLFEDIFAIPRKAVHEGNTIWLRDGQGRLRIRQVEVEFAGEKTLLVHDGLEDGDSLVVSDLAAPVEGMRLSLPGEEAPRERSGAPPPGPGKGVE